MAANAGVPGSLHAGYNGLVNATPFVPERAMPFTVEAFYENGVLKLAAPLPLQEHTKVHVTIHAELSAARQTAGLMGWTGSAELADRFAMDPELDFPLPAEER